MPLVVKLPDPIPLSVFGPLQYVEPTDMALKPYVNCSSGLTLFTVR